MLRYLEQQRYAATCDLCDDAVFFYSNSKQNAKFYARTQMFTFEIDGLTYCLCKDCLHKFKNSDNDICRPEREAVKRFNRSRKEKAGYFPK